MHRDTQLDPTPSPPRQRPLRELELEVAQKLFEALLVRLDRILARPFDKERVHQLAKLVQIASRLARKPD